MRSAGRVFSILMRFSAKRDFRSGYQCAGGSGLRVLGDREALHRILCNLVSNAVRSGGGGRSVGLSIRYEQDLGIYRCERSGERQSTKYLPTVCLDRLFTMEDSRSRRIQGNGLGLTIARNLATQMGGDIILQSEPFAETTFTVKLKRF